MQICTSFQTDNHTSTPPVFTGGCSSCRPTNNVKALRAQQGKAAKLSVCVLCYRVLSLSLKANSSRRVFNDLQGLHIVHRTLYEPQNKSKQHLYSCLAPPIPGFWLELIAALQSVLYLYVFYFVFLYPPSERSELANIL